MNRPTQVGRMPLWLRKPVLLYTCPTAGLIDTAATKGETVLTALAHSFWLPKAALELHELVRENTLPQTDQAGPCQCDIDLTISWTPIAYSWQGWVKRCLAASQSSATKTSCFSRSSDPQLCFLCRKRGQQRVWPSGSFLKAGLGRQSLPAGHPQETGAYRKHEL